MFELKACLCQKSALVAQKCISTNYFKPEKLLSLLQGRNMIHCKNGDASLDYQ